MTDVDDISISDQDSTCGIAFAFPRAATDPVQPCSQLRLSAVAFLFSVTVPSHGLDALDYEPPGEGARDHDERCKNEGSVE